MHWVGKLGSIGAIVSLCLSLATGCRGDRPKSFAAGVGGATKAALYEGLPHPMFEKRALEQERASKATVKLNDSLFYQSTLALSDEDDRALREIVCANDTFATFSGEKKCGGFHPDYCVEWRGTDGSTYRVLVCLGCHEAKLCGPSDVVRYDIQAAAHARLAAILTHYRMNRPEHVP